MSAPAAGSSTDFAATTRNPEASPLVAAYRRAVPVRIRRTVAAYVDPRLRNAVKRRLTVSQAVTDRITDRRCHRASRAWADVLEAADRRVVTVGHRPKVALVREHPSPLQAYGENLGKVCDALGSAGIDHFCVRGRLVASPAVAVPDADRCRAVAALARLCREQAGYVLLQHREAPGDRRRTVPGASPAALRHAERADVVRLAWYYTDASGSAVLDERHGCDVEFWRSGDGEAKTLVPPRPNRTVDRVQADSPRVEVPLSRTTWLAPFGGSGEPRVRTVPECAPVLPEDVTFPVDAVYTWVDGSDPAWRGRRAEAAGEAYHEEAANAARFISRDELRYSLRSLHQYAPWVRTVYLVTDGQVPVWLDTSHPRIRVVDHREIFSDPSVLPTFNSHAIESQLHHIDGLSEHFLYLNDDVFFGRLTVPQDFFLGNGLTRFFQSKAHIPPGLPSPEDVPVSVAGKNNRAVLEERFGIVVTQKTKHVPHALRRSVLYELEEEFAGQHRRTAANRFRSLDDLSVTSSLHHYYAYLTRRAVPGSIPYDYIDLSHPNAETRLGRLLSRRNRKVFCLNDTVSDGRDLESQLAVLHPFLKAYFPFAGPYEK